MISPNIQIRFKGNEFMKTLSLVCMLLTLNVIVSCAQSSPSQVETNRGPASVGAPQKLWGKPVADSEVDFLDELENSPAQNY